MADVGCATCSLWNSGTGRCRYTNATRVNGDTCSLTAAQRLALLKQARLIAGFYSTGRRVDILSVSVCPAGGHLVVEYQINGGAPKTRTIQTCDLAVLSELDAEALALVQMRALCILCGATTGAATRAVLEGSSLWLPGGS